MRAEETRDMEELEEYDDRERYFWIRKEVYYDKEGIHDDNLYALIFGGREVEVPDLSLQELRVLHAMLGRMLDIEDSFQRLFYKLPENDPEE